MLGIHVSKTSHFMPSSKNILDAINVSVKEFDINTAQIFTHGPRNKTKNKIDHEELNEFRLKNDFTIVVHSTYLTNPWKITNDNKESGRSIADINHLTEQLDACREIGAIGLVVHLPKKSIDVDEIYETMSILQKYVVKSKVMLLLEIEAAPNEISFGNAENLNLLCAELNELKSTKNWWGICIDTAHLWACNVDIRTKSKAFNWFKSLDKTVLDRIELVHLNGSYVEFGSNKDKHYVAGGAHDKIWKNEDLTKNGCSVFLKFCKKRNIPVICEINKGTYKESFTSLEYMKSILY